ncbi:alanine racemase [Alkalithermobacter paradoxus]|uniref:Alanine racemase n=1 Tax=Alkalithermobacter paradoxus TaxID=29349 RepID=A0A1V4I5L0_9FIRM|nr:alanine racemase [[Clostridium] thermoalcaliphilum]
MYIESRPTWAEININNLRDNFRSIKKIVKKDTKICGVVKANAYGHGSVHVANVLIQEGVDYLAVATFEEAIELRNNNINIPILCLGYIKDSDLEKAISNDIDITVYSYSIANELSKVAINLEKSANVHIKIDTGMSRLGFKADDKTVDTIERIHNLPNINIIGIYTHFARADEIDKSFTHSQFKEFMYIVEKLENKNINIPIKHVSNSAGIIDFPEYHLDMVRAGIVLYGHYPSEDVNKEALLLKPVMTLKTTVSNIKTLGEGRGVSYGHTYKVNETTKVATLPIGYADGFTRMLSGKVDVKINGYKSPIIGRICMDQCMAKVDVDDIKVGNVVEIFGEDEDLRIERFGKVLGTINYELLCMISRRVPRVYLEGNRVLHILDYLVK